MMFPRTTNEKTIPERELHRLSQESRYLVVDSDSLVLLYGRLRCSNSVGEQGIQCSGKNRRHPLGHHLHRCHLLDLLRDHGMGLESDKCGTVTL